MKISPFASSNRRVISIMTRRRRDGRMKLVHHKMNGMLRNQQCREPNARIIQHVLNRMHTVYRCTDGQMGTTATMSMDKIKNQQTSNWSDHIQNAPQSTPWTGIVAFVMERVGIIVQPLSDIVPFPRTVPVKPGVNPSVSKIEMKVAPPHWKEGEEHRVHRKGPKVLIIVSNSSTGPQINHQHLVQRSDDGS